MTEERDTNLKALLAAFGAVILWCWSGVCFRKGSEAMGAMVYLTFMTGVGAITAAILQNVRNGSFRGVFQLSPRMMVSGTFGVALYTIMLAAAFGIAPESDLGLINLINYMWPTWIVLLGILFLHEKPRILLTILGIGLGASGIIISRGFHQIALLPEDLTPPFLALGGALMWSFYSVLLRKWKIPADQGGTAFNFGICAVLAGIIGWYLGEWQNMNAWTLETVFWVLFGGIGPVGLAYSWWELGIKKGPVYLVASLAYFIPVGSSLLIGIIFRESLNSGLVAGAVLITVGAWVINLASKKI